MKGCGGGERNLVKSQKFLSHLNEVVWNLLMLYGSG